MNNELLNAVRNAKLAGQSDEQILQALSGTYPEVDIRRQLEALQYMRPVQSQALGPVNTVNEPQALPVRATIKSLAFWVIVMLVATYLIWVAYNWSLWLFDSMLHAYTGLEIPGTGKGFSKELNGYTQVFISLAVGATIYRIFRYKVPKWSFIIVGVFLLFTAALGIISGSGLREKMIQKQYQKYNERALVQVQKKRDAIRADFNRQGRFYSLTAPEGYTLKDSSYNAEMGRLWTTFENPATRSTLTILQYAEGTSAKKAILPSDKEFNYTTKHGLNFKESLSKDAISLVRVGGDSQISISLKPMGTDTNSARYVAENLKWVEPKDIVLYDIVCSDDTGGRDFNGSKPVKCETARF